MGVRHIPCGSFANESERLAAEYLKTRLTGTSGQWVLVTNHASSGGAQWLSDEIDMVVIGPTGVHVLEIKHWNAADLRTEQQSAEREADKLNEKARRLAGRLRKVCAFDIGFVAGKFLLTKGESEKFKEGTGRRRARGIEIFGLSEWKELLELDRSPILTDEQVATVCRRLEPQAKMVLGDKIRVFGDFFDLEPVPGPQDPFHRIYRGRRKPGRDRVILHLYDLSASKEKNASDIAKREFEVLQRLQKSPWLPSLLDSFQPAPGYPGELYFFSYVDTEAASLAERAADSDWSTTNRLYTATCCIQALKNLHEHGLPIPEGPILHRNLTPHSIRVRSNGEPLLTQLHMAKFSGAVTVAGAVASEFTGLEQFVAPEVLANGIGASTTPSDIYALCASLRILFEGDTEDPQAMKALGVFDGGLAHDPAARCSLDTLLHGLESIPQPKTAANRVAVLFWDEDTIKELHGRSYRIVTKLGSGSIGTTFKVMEIDPSDSHELSGPYVAKVITNSQVGAAATSAYAKVRAQTGTPHLAGVLEVASEWKPEEITALLKWVQGDPLSDWIGILPLYFDELAQGSREEIALRWLRDLCDGLFQLHQVGLVHGDVSPKNIIVSGSNVTLTDFDLATSAGAKPLGGTPLYCAPTVDVRTSIVPSDDVFALAATLFHVLFDRPPFQFALRADKRRGLNWEGIDRSEWPRLTLFLDTATHPDTTQRFHSAKEAMTFLDAAIAGKLESTGALQKKSEDAPFWTDNTVPWLTSLLQSYPGSPKGNAETRGLDSEFARQTYVTTRLDTLLAEDIRNRKVSLVILCGNAGDGKTAFLQNLAATLGLDVGPSARRFWDYALPDGLRIRANLDGSAAFQGRSAKELLDDFFVPFQHQPFPDNLVHLIAINDGPLLAWLENASHETHLTNQLRTALEREELEGLDSRIRFIDLNARSLVGGSKPGSATLSTEFLDQLLEKLLGGSQDVWAPCKTCTAQTRCHAWQSVRSLRDSERGQTLRTRLARALRAVHQRGEFHITARSLRAALCYIFFGVHDCTDLHADPNLRPALYYDRAFDPESENRQGELLAELQLLDPALESHPSVDRSLLREEAGKENTPSPDRERALLRSLRRRAYFELPDEKIREIGGSAVALDLARGQHLTRFLLVGTGTDADREEICAELCQGIARLEDLPEKAYQDPQWVPLKITPRTPTETAFWVNKPRDRFSIHARYLRAVEGLDTLHTHVVLTYRFSSGYEEELVLGAELFHLLMELKNGYQLSDAQSDDVFANLSIFKQRLAQEEDRTLFAWNPLDERIFKLSAALVDGIQRVIIAEAKQEVSK